MPRALLLLLPSLTSSVFVLLLTLFIMGTSAWSYINENQLFYDFIFGVHGFKTMVEASDTATNIQYLVFNGPLTYHILLIASALIIGGMVYVLLEGVGRAAAMTKEDLHNISHSNTNKQAAREALMRLMLRVISAIGWTIYIALFVNVLVPFAVVLVQTAVDALELSLVSFGLNLLSAAVMLIVTIHTHIIFARLCMLRPRLFGDSEIEEAEFHQW